MSRRDGPIIVARIREGRMCSVRYFTNREVGAALAFVQSARDHGDTVTVTVLDRADGTGVSDTDKERLLRQPGRRKVRR